MLGLTGLITPLIAAAGVLLGIAVADIQEIYIRELTVPPSLSGSGYTADVVEHRINDNILAIERAARTRPETRRLATDAEQTPVELIAQYLNLQLLVRAIQDSSRFIDYTISASIVHDGPRHVMQIHVRHRSGQRTLVRFSRPVAEVDQLLQDAADAILRVTDPHIMCTYRLRQGLLASPRNLDDAYSCITQTLPLANTADKVWLYNLLGVVTFLRDDQAAALRAFQAALRIDRDFSPAMLNLGILLAQNGRHEDAIRAFRDVFYRPSVGESPQTYAAAYTEWANSLIALRRPAEARARYADAIRIDHRYAPAYFAWAQTLPPGPEQDELRRYGTTVSETYDQIYTENLIGAMRAGQAPGRRE